MTKVIIEITKDKTKKDNCKIAITHEGYEKATKIEKEVTATVWNAVHETIGNLQKLDKNMVND